MSIESLYSALEAKGFDTYLNTAPDGTECPYLVIEAIDHPNFFADNKTFTKTTSLRLRLVEAEVHDWSLIAKLEKALDDLGFPYSSEDVSDTAERVCETYYNINFLGGNKNG